MLSGRKISTSINSDNLKIKKISTGLFGSRLSFRQDNTPNAPTVEAIPAMVDDVYNFKIISSIQVKNHWITLIQYPNCTNFEGKKILMTTKELTSRNKIDPHFFEEGDRDNIGLVARFVPNQEGIRMALILANNLP